MLEVAWFWRDNHAVPELDQSDVRFLRELELQKMEKVAPATAAIVRQQAESARASIREHQAHPHDCPDPAADRRSIRMACRD